MRWKIAAGAALVSLSLTLVPGAPVWAAPSQQNLDTLTKVYTLLTDSHFSHPDQEKLLQGAIQGMLDAIGDPFTNYMSPEEYQAFMGAIEQQYAGIGAAMQPGTDRVTIAEVFPGTPAEKAGLQAGDEIIAVDGVPAAQDPSGVPERVRGAAGTVVELTVRRGDRAPWTVRITRAPIQLPTVATDSLGDGVAYMRVYSFADNTADEFEQKLAKIEAQHARGLVLDLRGNGGGYVSSALQMADDLLSQGTILIYHDEEGKPQEITADPAASRIPLVVLVDRNSASASEMLAGALQKNGRAVLMGEQTFGKGTMQEPVELPNGGFLKVSIDRWELADGTSPDHVGLHPDAVFGYQDLAIHAAKEALLPDQPRELRLPLSGGGAVIGGIAVTGAPAVLRQDGQLYLPLRFTVEALGHEVDWLDAERAVRFTLGEHAIKANPGSGTLLIDADRRELQQPLLMQNGLTYLSVDAFRAISGATVTVQDGSVAVETR